MKINENPQYSHLFRLLLGLPLYYLIYYLHQVLGRVSIAVGNGGTVVDIDLKFALNVTVLLPFCVSFFFLAFGNYSQHMFVDGRKPYSNYGLAYNCVNTEVRR